MDTLTIDQVARKAGVHVETVRYYERRGLIVQPSKPRSGYRRYDPEIVARIRFVKRAQDLGFTLEEITELLALKVDPGTTCCEVREQAEAKIAAIEDKIRVLRRMVRSLETLVEACREERSTTECPILEALEREGE